MDAGVILAAARSHGEVPILFGDWIAPGTTVVSIGSTVPSQREVDPSVIERCDLMVCDVVDEVLNQSGDLLAVRELGLGADLGQKTHSLHELISGALDERVSAAKMPLFKSVGNGLQDIVAAGQFLDRAIAAGTAVRLPLPLYTKT